MQSYVNYLQGLYSAIISDIAVHYPSLRRDCERDVSRLLSLINSRGLPFLMIELPEFGKHFDRCLSEQRLTISRMAGQRPYKRGTVIPRLFKGLLLRVFDDSGLLRADSDVDCIRYLRQLYYTAKKVKVQCSDSSTWEHVSEFFETDRKVRCPSLDWESNELRISALQYLHLGDTCSSSPAPLFGFSTNSFTDVEESLDTLAYGAFDATQRVADIVSACVGRFNPLEWRAKHGPGAVADQRHTQFKYDFPNWPAKLSNAFPVEDFGFANHLAWADFVRRKDAHDFYKDHEPPSRLIAVPKTLKGPRLIAAEPTAYQWCQQTILDFLTTRLKETPISDVIHFRDQTQNQDFARRASHTQSHVTVDLSSASDRLSCWVVERIFRRNPTLVTALHSSRTRWVANGIDAKSPQYHVLKKFACMGSACTFPVQSIVFSILAISAVLYSRNKPITIKNIRRTAREVRVFGDDIIVPKDGWIVLQGLLGHLGLKVNHKKTYDTGMFRESCGLDAYDGNIVTPTYTMTYPEVSRPESIMSSVATHNNFLMGGYWHAAEYVKSRVHALKRFAFRHVPIGSGAFGWYSVHADNGHLQRRWNPYTQTQEYRCDMPYSKSPRSLPESDSLLLQYFTVARRPAPYLEGDRLGVVGRVAVKVRRNWVPANIY